MYQEDAEYYEHQRELVALEVDRRKGTYTTAGPASWVVCDCGCDDFPGGNCKSCGKAL